MTDALHKCGECGQLNHRLNDEKCWRCGTYWDDQDDDEWVEL